MRLHVQRSLAAGLCLALGLLSGLTISRAEAAEPVACLDSDPSQWPVRAKPYVLLIADSSNGAATPVLDVNSQPVYPSCAGYPATYGGHMRCAISQITKQLAGQVNFGLMQYASKLNCSSSSCASGCTVDGLAAGATPSATCGAEPTSQPNDEDRRGGRIVLPISTDDRLQTTNDLPQLLSWVDNSCASNQELTEVPVATATVLAPVNGALRDAQRYFQGTFKDPLTNQTYASPFDVNELSCRKVVVILLQTANESCDASGSAVDAAGDLYAGFTVGSNTVRVKTHVVRVGTGATAATSDAIAAAGGTSASLSATTSAAIQSALSSILIGLTPAETCDNADNDCNGCTDEGFLHYANVQTSVQACCTGARATCLATYQASISAANPKGDLALLPCTTYAESLDPTKWLCFNPGETCDNIDNNGQGGIDEGVKKCGSPLHCPTTEVCNGQDDDCDGLIDEGNVCGACIPSPEICDGCDNDCDGIADNGSLASIPCGQTSPLNCAGTISCKLATAVPFPGACIPNGGYGACNYAPQAETCDGVDNNCNGLADDGVPSVACVPAGTPPGLNYGPNSQCRQGVTTCGNGSTLCQGFVGPSAEICDGVDNDCDGSVDESPYGVGQPCGANQPPCTSGVTACVNGALVCQGGVRPQSEKCDGVDNDCNGAIDDGPLSDAPSPSQLGCDSRPEAACGPTTVACTGPAGWVCQFRDSPATEVCDGVDNDCNGTVDDNVLGGGEACGSSVGECRPGVAFCDGGVLRCAGGILPQTEICDGLDNNCDGEIDNGVAEVGAACQVAYDTLAFPGNRAFSSCRPGTLVCDGANGLACSGVGPTAEICDGIDNDCDGQIDEVGEAPDGLNGSADPADSSHVIGAACGVQSGTCQEGTWTCRAGVVACSAMKPATEICDGLDNDCDGSVDNENGAGGPPLCGQGTTCVNRGTMFRCAQPCASGRFECPTGQTCQDVALSGSGTSGRYCLPPAGSMTLLQSDSKLGCSSSSGTGMLGLFLASLLLLRRRRLAAVAMVAVLSACSSDKPSVVADAGDPPGTDAGVVEDAGTKGDAGTEDGGVDAGPCVPSTEICDGEDNDCDGMKDNVDVTLPEHCGGCANNCYTKLVNVDPYSVTCESSQCVYKACATNYVDLEPGAPGCETYCVNTGEEVCDGRDNDCNGQVDETIDLSYNVLNCGACGISCVAPHGTPSCAPVGSVPTCGVQSCECSGSGNCWWNVDGVAANGCEYRCDLTNGGVELCDGLDNDCNGVVDDLIVNDERLNQVCFGSAQGACADASNAGITVCQRGQVICTGPNVLVPGARQEECNGVDDDCDGQTDNNVIDVNAGTACGMSGTSPCRLGIYVCTNGQMKCQGAINPSAEVCNGIDDDCDGHIDLTGTAPPIDATGSCDVPVAPPAGATSACSAGTVACVNGRLTCANSTKPAQGAVDACGVDSNCDGQLTNQPNTQTDVNNCGSCGKRCGTANDHAQWACASSQCVFQGCQQGYYDLDGDQRCEYPCSFTSAQESCNGKDDNCDGNVDENPVKPSPTVACGVSPAATAAECTSGVNVQCQNGNWKCSFPAGVCTGPTCALTEEVCDSVDNNCNGLLNENVARYGAPCASDDQSPLSQGLCRTTGTFVCAGPRGVICSAVKADCNTLPGGCTELCDGLDNDCDGAVDEPYNSKGLNPTYFVKPAVTQVASNLWVYSVEASRPSATSIVPGTGNGYHCATCFNGVPSAPGGVTIDATPACTASGKLPWGNVSGVEAEQVCQAAGGRLCTATEWQTMCAAGSSCRWGYSPADASCTTSATASKFCNLASTYDFSTAAGIQTGLLASASSKLMQCSADWSTQFGNGGARGSVYDVTGNLRELVKTSTGYALMGGSFSSLSEDASACGETGFAVDGNYRQSDTGFRCCFSSDPTK
jgi:uncharacterized protein (TIGR03382 family)